MFVVGIHLDNGHLRSHSRLVLVTSYTSMLMALFTTAMTSPLLRRLGYPNGTPAPRRLITAT